MSETSKKTGTKANKSVAGIPQPQETYGAGYLYHYYPQYQEFAQRLAQVGGEVDIYEVLGIQFNADPDSLIRFAEELAKPITLHSFEYCLGNIDLPPKDVFDRIQLLANNCNSVYIGEHLAIMGTSDQYIGGFLQPLGTDEQTKLMVGNLKKIKKISSCPLLIENASQFYRQHGGVSLGRQLREVSEAADVGILLSLSNISISDNFQPQDREAFLSELPFERVRQLHVFCGNTDEEQMPGMEKARMEHEWSYKMMHELAKDPAMRPSSVIFELETGTPSLPAAEKLRDYMNEARALFFSDKSQATVLAGENNAAS
ncbi:MAG: DUF692 family protein [Phycisphaeraceae bacterium]|nr:DUF692 family protein [Phycisphaeraceae bacterium]